MVGLIPIIVSDLEVIGRQSTPLDKKFIKDLFSAEDSGTRMKVIQSYYEWENDGKELSSNDLKKYHNVLKRGIKELEGDVNYAIRTHFKTTKRQILDDIEKYRKQSEKYRKQRLGL